VAILPLSTGSVQNARMQHISQYVGDLRSTIGYYTGWIPEDTYHDVEKYYDILESDAAIWHAINLISLMAAGEYYQVAGQNLKFNKIVMRGLSYIERFTHARKSMAARSLLYGLSVQKKYWKKVTWPEFPGMTWNVPYRLAEVDKRRLRIERDLEDKTKLYWTIWCPVVDQYLILEDRAETPTASLAVQDFVWYWYTDDEQSPYYKGMGETLYSLAYMKQRVLQYWAELSEHFGRPIMIATIDAARAAVDAATSGGAGVQDASTIVSNWISLLENMRSRHVAVKPNHDSIDVIEGGSVGQNILQQLIEYLDNKIQLLILGAELTTMAPGVGSYALGQVHKSATDSIVLYNRQNIEEIIERDLIYDFYLRNKYNFQRLGLKWMGPSGCKFNIAVKQEELREDMMQQPGMMNPRNMQKEMGM